MGFRINTNIAALNAHNNGVVNNRELDKSLSRLSSGLRINTAADDASGMSIADSLRSQANSLGQAVRNANDAIGIIQTADKAMDEQIKILDTIKTKAIQAASATQNATSRQAIQSDVNRLIEQLDNIANTTSFNGQALLNGTYTNKEYQIGAFSNQTVNASIGNTQSLAVGNITSKTDVAAVGNTVSVALTAAINEGTLKITLGDVLTGLNATGVAQGDTIRIDGLGDYKIENIDGSVSAGGAMSNAIITFDRPLEKTLSVGSAFSFSLMSTGAEDLSSLSDFTVATTAQTTTVDSTDISGFAVGDKLNVTTSLGETKTFNIVQINGSADNLTSGSIVLSSADTIGTVGSLALGSISVNDRASLGTDFTSNDYVQYTVGGIQLEGVQLTEEILVTKSDGSTATFAMGTSQTGLGRVADLINATSAETGIKALAIVDQNSSIRVQGGAISDDVYINGERILTEGTQLVEGDSNNTLVNAINSKTNLTGVSATLEVDGSLTLTSDGRTIVTDGLSAAAGINDGVHAGVLQFTSLSGGSIDVTSKSFTNSGLTQAAQADINTFTQIEQTNVLSDLVYGQVDDNNDGIIDASDTVGLLSTSNGAMLAMDIVQASLSQLDAVRADLGSVQNQLVVTVNNISVTAVNVRAAESQIRDVDFAAESANFSKHNILAQSGSYAMSQANAIQQNVLSLLQ